MTKLNSLEEKIKEYLVKRICDESVLVLDSHEVDDIAHDITEICEKEMVTQKIYNGLQKFAVTVEKENAELKEQIANQKHLNRQKVEKIIIMSNTIEETITAICNLAIKSIVKNRVIEVLKKYKVICTTPGTNFLGDIEQIAEEILKDKENI